MCEICDCDRCSMDDDDIIRILREAGSNPTRNDDGDIVVDGGRFYLNDGDPCDVAWGYARLGHTIAIDDCADVSDAIAAKIENW